MNIEIQKCQNHDDSYCIAIMNEPDPNGWGSGQRITSNKCCGMWDTVKKWTIDETMIKDLRKLLSKAKRELQGQNKYD